MARAWRLIKTRYLGQALSGDGAARTGGRWNSPGIKAVYASDSLALAALELLVRLGMADAPVGYSALAIEFDKKQVTELDRASLPDNWRLSPPPVATQAIGDGWIGSRNSVALRVPSVIIPEESNYLFNPAHPAFAHLVVRDTRPFEFDPRLIR